jgi:hypothetical protein
MFKCRLCYRLSQDHNRLDAKLGFLPTPVAVYEYIIYIFYRICKVAILGQTQALKSAQLGSSPDFFTTCKGDQVTSIVMWKQFLLVLHFIITPKSK